MSFALILEDRIIEDVKGVVYVKELDLSKSIYELAKDDEHFIMHMEALGFDGITNKVSLQTVGRVMTLKKGAKVKNIDLDTVRLYFLEQGYQIKE